jgi:pyruvate formate lyase activating enzyme
MGMTTMSQSDEGQSDTSLASLLDAHTAAGRLCRAEGDKVRCVACGHRCLIGPGRRGVCKVRFNRAGELRVPFGYVAGLASDPVEKKPFFHLYPGSDALTFGMMGCDFHCAYCQNWVSSQALRDSASLASIRSITPEQLVAAARSAGARVVVSSYNEPLITAEWAVAVFEKARAAGMPCAFVSNGNATPEVLDFLQPWLTAFKVDLKAFNEAHYRALGGTLGRVLESIREVHRRGLWLEVVTLLVPGFNDAEGELRELTRFLVSVSPDIPWHVTAFHPDYKMNEPRATRVSDLQRAARIGREEGLRFVYAGNLPGEVGEGENTRCPGCGQTVIERRGYAILKYALDAQGRCPRCQATLPGVWPPGGGAEVSIARSEPWWSRRPRQVA